MQVCVEDKSVLEIVFILLQIKPELEDKAPWISTEQ